MRLLVSLIALLTLLQPVWVTAQDAPSPDNPYQTPQPNPAVWPECVPGQVEVMLLGTVHMNNPGLDLNNVDVPDVRTPALQAELEELTERLAAYAPQKVMVESVWSEDPARLDAAYAAYLAADGTTQSRREAEQIGFRLARRLGLGGVYPIDYTRGMDRSEMQAYAADGGPTIHTMDYGQLIPERFRVDVNEVVRQLSMTEYHAWLNDDVALRANHFEMFGMALGAGTGEAYPGPDLLAAWYGRNLNMVHHILRGIEPGDQRVFVLVGSGHVRVMRHLLNEAPHFCPVSPLPYLG
ncbi:MAG: DUF5694 domain-containing protein [Bacteroidota bacterium]